MVQKQLSVYLGFVWHWSFSLILQGLVKGTENEVDTQLHSHLIRGPREVNCDYWEQKRQIRPLTARTWERFALSGHMMCQ